ncbi:hypothetical protein T484DRAFT_1824930 [Baffinella frigidus]|nr:hypothetical protein T484DRAFT_1824930 [Cryptophyta sp. CCMP2293]
MEASFLEASAVVASADGELDRGDFEWAWALERCLLPLADLLNHSPTSAPPPRGGPGFQSGGGSEKSKSRGGPVVGSGDSGGSGGGPTAAAEAEGGDMVFRATREIARGEEVTWSYGRLSNEELLLAVGFALPSSLFARSLAALSKECPAPPDVEERKTTLLQRLNALPTEAGGDTTLNFSVYLGGEPFLERGPKGPPAPLSTIVRTMCVTSGDELAEAGA